MSETGGTDTGGAVSHAPIPPTIQAALQELIDADATVDADVTSLDAAISAEAQASADVEAKRQALTNDTASRDQKFDSFVSAIKALWAPGT